MRIFLIEDDNHLRDILATFLDMKGHEVFPAANPTGCPAYDSTGEPCPHEHPCGDVLVIDQNMPEMTGLEFIQMQIERGCKGSVHNKLIISSDLNKEEMDLATRLGCTVMLKPFSMLSLLEWLESVEKKLAPDRELFDFQMQ